MTKAAFTILLFLAAMHQAASARTDIPVTFSHDGLSVDARLTLPAGPPPYRVIVIAPGTGANDKDGTLPMYGANVSCLYPALLGDTLRPYRGLADALADSGFAVLTYDKLEYSYPTGLGAITFHKLWLPVESGLNYLKTRTDIDTSHMVLLGHSEGSTLIPYIARSQPGVNALISLAGPRRSPYDTLLAYQLYTIAKTCGGDTAAAKLQGSQLITYFNFIRSGSWNASTPDFAGVSAAVWADYLKVSDSVAINYDLAMRPMLFIGLGDDMNVPISTELSGFRRDITGPADFFEVGGLNHYLSTATDPSVSEALTDTIVYWLRRHNTALAVPAVQPAGGRPFEVAYGGGQWRITSGTETIREVAVYDMSGRCIYKALPAGKEHTILMEAPASGLYVIAVSGSGGRRFFKVVM
jgi:dienelactone hydrolase